VACSKVFFPPVICNTTQPGWDKEKDRADEIYRTLQEGGVEILYDDQDKFTVSDYMSGFCSDPSI